MEETPLCRICGRRPVDSPEHIPPQSQGNVGEIEVTLIQIDDAAHRLHRIHEMFRDGFFRRVLCSRCNHRYGSIYNTSYTEFVRQVANASGLRDPKGRVLVHLKDVYPLRILKQMFLMYICVQLWEDGWPYIREFVRRRDDRLPQDAPHVYLYRNVSNTGRIVPWHGLGELRTGRPPLTLSEVSYPPIGLVFCDDQDDRFALMEDITSWGQYEFSKKTSIVLRLPDLQVSTSHPLGFGTEDDVERWRLDCGVIWFIPRPGDSPSQPGASASLHPRKIVL